MSIQMVADGSADMAAIDWVTWRLATAHQAEARQLRVLTMTEAAPGLPYIAAARFDAGPLGDAVERGIAALDPIIKASLGLRGFVRTRPDDYDIIDTRIRATARVSGAHAPAAGGA